MRITQEGRDTGSGASNTVNAAPAQVRVNQELTGMDPLKEKKLYIFASDTSRTTAQTINYTLSQKLEKLKRDNQINS